MEETACANIEENDPAITAKTILILIWTLFLPSMSFGHSVSSVDYYSMLCAVSLIA
jgi:hypothetical protein